MAVLWSGDKAVGWLAADNLIKREPLTYHLDILKLYGATLGHLISQNSRKKRCIARSVPVTKRYSITPPTRLSLWIIKATWKTAILVLFSF